MSDAPSPVVFVTGSAARRVGRSIVERFLREGFAVVVHSHRAPSGPSQIEMEQWLQQQGTQYLWLYGSVDDEPTVQRWVEEIVTRFGRLDVVVHSAATWESKSLEETSRADVQRSIDVNLIGSFLVAKYAGLAMCQQESGGSLLLIGDWATQRPYRDFAAYFMSKGAIPTLVRTMAVELASRNPKMRVNGILPGPVLLCDGTDDSIEAKVREQSLLKRLGQASDIADAAFFLAMQPFTTGVCLPIDGGRTIHSPQDDEAISHPSKRSSHPT